MGSFLSNKIILKPDGNIERSQQMNQQNVSFNYVVKNIGQLGSVKDLTLIKGYHQIFEHELNYGLHPDGFDDPESGWPEDIKPICAEMWRRVDDPASKINIEICTT